MKIKLSTLTLLLYFASASGKALRPVFFITPSIVIKNSNGVKVTDLAEAEAVAAQWSEELFALHQLKTKEQVIQQIAETRDLLHLVHLLLECLIKLRL